MTIQTINTAVYIKRKRIHGSSMLASVGYSPSTQTLEARFMGHDRNSPSIPGGSIYRYGGVPRDAYQTLLEAESKGQAFNSLVKQADYKFIRVR